MPIVLLLIALLLTPSSVPAAAQEPLFEASSAAIREVVGGKQCIGEDLLIFGKSSAGNAGSYERVGRPLGEYKIGYGTILILRGKDLHSHVATVSVRDHMLYMSAEKFRCDP